MSGGGGGGDAGGKAMGIGLGILAGCIGLSLLMGRCQLPSVAVDQVRPYTGGQAQGQSGIKYTGRSCARREGGIGREGYGPGGQLGCWKY